MLEYGTEKSNIIVTVTQNNESVLVYACLRQLGVIDLYNSMYMGSIGYNLVLG